MVGCVWGNLCIGWNKFRLVQMTITTTMIIPRNPTLHQLQASEQLPLPQQRMLPLPARCCHYPPPTNNPIRTHLVRISPHRSPTNPPRQPTNCSVHERTQLQPNQHPNERASPAQIRTSFPANRLNRTMIGLTRTTQRSMGIKTSTHEDQQESVPVEKLVLCSVTPIDCPAGYHRMLLVQRSKPHSLRSSG